MLRPIPFPVGSEARRNELRLLRKIYWFNPAWAIQTIQIANKIARMFPVKGERCEARTRTGAPCKRKAGKNGRCPNHGGATPKRPHKTPESRARSLANLKQYRAK